MLTFKIIDSSTWEDTALFFFATSANGFVHGRLKAQMLIAFNFVAFLAI